MEYDKKKPKSVVLLSSVMTQRSLPNAPSYPSVPRLRLPALCFTLLRSPARLGRRYRCRRKRSLLFLLYDHRSEVIHRAILDRHRHSVELPIKRTLRKLGRRQPAIAFIVRRSFKLVYLLIYMTRCLVS